MTKIGEGNTSGEEPTIDTYKRELDSSATKFLQALEQYNDSASSEQQAHFKLVMNQQMAIIQATVRELNKRGLHKGAATVVKDYMDYKDEQTAENYTCLHNDVETLRDLNRS